MATWTLHRLTVYVTLLRAIVFPSHYTNPMYHRMINVHIPTTVPKIAVSLRRLELIMPRSELIPGKVPWSVEKST